MVFNEGIAHQKVVIKTDVDYVCDKHLGELQRVDDPIIVADKTRVSDTSKWAWINKCIRNYCDTTTLHGFKYLSEPDRPLFERFYWFIAIIIVYLTVTFVIMDQVTNFLRSPVLISFDSKSKSVEEIPFPAVTFCTDNQIKPSVINLTAAFHNVSLLSPEMLKRFQFAAYVCKFNSSIKGVETFDSEFVHEMLQKTYGQHACEEQVPSLRWVSFPVTTPCKYLQPMVTTYGGCLSFNMLPLAQIFRDSDIIFDNWAKDFWANESFSWSPDTGFGPQKGSYPGPPPWKTAGSNMGNTVFFDLNLSVKDFGGLCSRGGRGFFVYIHNPAEMPSASDALVYIEENRDTTVSAIPKLYITDSSLNDWSPNQRGCYFQEERSLRYFKIYTQHNCELECEANYTLDNCDCIPFYYPRTNDTPICGPGKILCIETSLAKAGETMTYRQTSLVCDCLPSCSELQYEVRITKATRYWSQDIHSANNSFSILRVKFQTKFFIGIKRSVMFSFSDFVANVGGLLGLFLGFSILSLVEIIYFLFFRPCTNMARRKKLEKIERKELKQMKQNSFPNQMPIGYPYADSISKSRKPLV